MAPDFTVPAALRSSDSLCYDASYVYRFVNALLERRAKATT
jgi:hypothetical protein